MWKTRTAQRKPLEQRWLSEAPSVVVGVPWRTSGTDPDADGESTKGKITRPGDGKALKEDEREPWRR